MDGDYAEASGSDSLDIMSEITIEAWSSAFEDLDNRRANAIALKEIWLQAAASWVNVDLEDLFKTVFWTFEWINPDQLIKSKEEIVQIPWATWWWEEVEWQTQQPTAQELTEQVAGGQLNL